MFIVNSRPASTLIRHCLQSSKIDVRRPWGGNGVRWSKGSKMGHWNRHLGVRAGDVARVQLRSLLTAGRSWPLMCRLNTFMAVFCHSVVFLFMLSFSLLLSLFCRKLEVLDLIFLLRQKINQCLTCAYLSGLDFWLSPKIRVLFMWPETNWSPQNCGFFL